MYQEQPKYGGMPYEQYVLKESYSNISENPHQTHDYMKNVLIDRSPDKPFLESDFPRVTNELGGGGVGSLEKLELRHTGARVGEDPWLPDGEFLAQEFLERDPRGTATGPNMQKCRDQGVARTPYIKLYSDEDNSVPSQGINPAQMIDNIKNGFYRFKDAYKNFAESVDNWHNGGTKQVLSNPRDIYENTETSGMIKNLADVSVRNRTDPVNMLSNDPTIAFRHTTPDHRVKVARYDSVRGSSSKFNQDVRNNQHSTYLDQIVSNYPKGERVNRLLANTISDLEGQNLNKINANRMDKYGDSQNAQQRLKKLSNNDLRSILEEGQISSDLTANAKNFNVSNANRKTMSLGDVSIRDMFNVPEINVKIKNIITSVNQMSGPSQSSDLRTSIENTAKQTGIFQQNTTKKRQTDQKNISRLSDANGTVFETKSIANYGAVQASSDTLFNKFDEDQDKSNSLKNSTGYKIQGAKPIAVSDFEFGQAQLLGYNDFSEVERSSVRKLNNENANSIGETLYGDMHIGGKRGGTKISDFYKDDIFR